jgi:hypothetical protein
MKAKLYQEIEEERQKLCQDRKAFENIVHSHSKALSHVGEVEEDEESRHSRQSRDVKITDSENRAAKAMNDMEIKLSEQIEMVRAEMVRENVMLNLMVGKEGNKFRKQAEKSCRRDCEAKGRT